MKVKNLRALNCEAPTSEAFSPMSDTRPSEVGSISLEVGVGILYIVFGKEFVSTTIRDKLLNNLFDECSLGVNPTIVVILGIYRDIRRLLDTEPIEQ